MGKNDTYRSNVIKKAKGNSQEEDDMIDRMSWRGVCRAYISQRGAIHQPDVGSRSYHEMFTNASRDTRYVVVEDDTGVFIVFDLWRTQEVVAEGSGRIFIQPKKGKTYTDLDHAIGATVMAYDDNLMSRWDVYPSVTKLTNIWKEWSRR